jgi:hypothetical protein
MEGANETRNEPVITPNLKVFTFIATISSVDLPNINTHTYIYISSVLILKSPSPYGNSQLSCEGVKNNYDSMSSESNTAK